jgi:hypothetical protein
LIVASTRLKEGRTKGRGVRRIVVSRIVLVVVRVDDDVALAEV